jgi:hypothetical protein
MYPMMNMNPTHRPCPALNEIDSRKKLKTMNKIYQSFYHHMARTQVNLVIDSKI